MRRRMRHLWGRQHVGWHGLGTSARSSRGEAVQRLALGRPLLLRNETYRFRFYKADRSTVKQQDQIMRPKSREKGRRE
jgi:hypothetical protein